MRLCGKRLLGKVSKVAGNWGYMDSEFVQSETSSTSIQNREKSPLTNPNDTEVKEENGANKRVNHETEKDVLNVKNLKGDEILPKVREIVEDLQKCGEYNTADALKLVKSINNTYRCTLSIKRKIVHIFLEYGFADVALKVLKDLDTKGIFKDDSVWFPAYYILVSLWNFTDFSHKFARKVAEAGGVRIFTVNCGHKPYLEALDNKNVYHVVKSSMSILHNIARTTGVSQYFKENNTADVMVNYLSTYGERQDKMLKILSLLILSHIVEEDENEKLIDDTGAIEAIIKCINLALKHERRRCRGFTPQELLSGISKIAINDKNKKKITDAGALPVFLSMLKSGRMKEQAITAKTIWTMAFDKEVCGAIVQYNDMIQTLEGLKDSSDEEVQRNIKGALFVLKGENDVLGRPKSARSNRGHIFLSYSWNEKEIVYQLRDKLKERGFTVWIDIENMGGSTLTAMAEAVENAELVLIGMSEKYKQSPNCRLEAEYAFKLDKRFIPLMLQTKYRPDGWLGIILGAKLYFDFSGKYPFDKSWQGLEKEIKSLNQTDQLPPMNAKHSFEHTDLTDSPGVLNSHIPQSRALSVVQKVAFSTESLEMSREEVSDWLRKHELERCLPSMAMFDGKHLCQLKEMKMEAPEFYYHALDVKLGMSLLDILTFTAVLNKL